MADKGITPYGYIYGKDPKANHPFWGGGSGPDIDEYVKSLNGTVTDTPEGKVYTINATDGDDVVTKVIDILVPNGGSTGVYAENVTVESQHSSGQTVYTVKYSTSDDVEHVAGTIVVPDVPVAPSDYVTSVVISHSDTSTSDTYSFKYVTKDGVEHQMGSVYVSKDYVSSVRLYQATSSGVNTLTLDVDGTLSSFDVPVAYVKSITQSGGSVSDDVYTVTDEMGHTLNISTPGEYVQNVSASGGALSQRKIVNGVAQTENVQTIHLQTPAESQSGKYHIDVSDGVSEISLEWDAGGSGGLPAIGDYKACVVSGSLVCTNIYLSHTIVTPIGTISNGSSGAYATSYIRPQVCYIPTQQTYFHIDGVISSSYKPVFTPDSSHSGHQFTILGGLTISDVQGYLSGNTIYINSISGYYNIVIWDSTSGESVSACEYCLITNNWLTQQNITVGEL